ncbi:unnamed protein product, partial [Callosobruchus maculatus]
FAGRGADFVGGIDNEALDFSQLEDFINNDGSQGNSTYFSESLNSAVATSATGKLLNVIVENKRNNNSHHSLPDSPPDSSSEHPYSPQDGCPGDPTGGGQPPPSHGSSQHQPTLYTSIYKPEIMSPLLSGTGGSSVTDGLILGSHIVVADHQSDQITNAEHLLGTGANLTSDRIILTTAASDGTVTVSDNNRPILMSTDSPQSFDRNIHLNYNHNIESIQRNNIDNSLCDSNLDNIQNVYTNLQSIPKKRKLSQDSMLVKSEPDHCSSSQLSPSEQGNNTSLDEDYASSEACLSEPQYQCIKFSPFQQNNWHTLCDQNLSEILPPLYRVDADKGFNFSNADDAFVCQKKNHFQITCQVQLLGDAQFVKTADGLQKISSFHLHFYGVKHDCPTQTIRVEQSQSDRSKKPFHPVPVELVNSQVTKVTVGRLHFSETTSNNMRKKGKPNPEQRYFQLVVGLHAHTTSGNFPVISHASQKIIVRASNPGQFESDVELCWQKGQTQDSVVHSGRVGINTDRPDESLVVHGNIKITGHIIQPSDIRAKKNIVECNTAEQLKNVQRLRVVRYEYEPELAAQLNRDNTCSDTGVIAQEVAQVLPEAVKPAGDIILQNGTSIDNFLVVNKERIFMENIGAVKELCKVTDNLENRIDQLERINRRLNKLKRGDSLKSTSTVNSSKLSYGHKCSKHHHACQNEEELCSNKFIQIVIVVLVLIMAFCLAAITTLYLMEAARRSQYLPPNMDTPPRSHVTKGPTKSTKIHSSWTSTSTPRHTTNHYKEEEVRKVVIGQSMIKRPSFIIGRPQECLTVEQDLESTNLCKIYCCLQRPPQELVPAHFSEKKPPSLNRNKTLPLINVEKNKISKPFHSNDIEKQIRQKRDTYTDEANLFDISDDQLFTIIIEGRNFSTPLGYEYRNPEHNSQYNISYSVPISKYMPDDFVNLIFRSNQPNIKEIEHCYNDRKMNECSYMSSSPYFEDKLKMRHKVNENSPSQLLGIKSIIFEVDMIDFQSKVMTYRASLGQSESTCNLSPGQLGLEYIEYNFYFYRRCDE